jgi:hypothetical protein
MWQPGWRRNVIGYVGYVTSRSLRHSSDVGWMNCTEEAVMFDGHHVAVAEGFEPPVGVSRLSLSRRVH